MHWSELRGHVTVLIRTKIILKRQIYLHFSQVRITNQPVWKHTRPPHTRHTSLSLCPKSAFAGCVLRKPWVIPVSLEVSISPLRPVHTWRPPRAGYGQSFPAGQVSCGAERGSGANNLFLDRARTSLLDALPFSTVSGASGSGGWRPRRQSIGIVRARAEPLHGRKIDWHQ